jgi:hypothetical protein
MSPACIREDGKSFSPQNLVGKASSSSDDATIFVEHKIMMRSLNRYKVTMAHVTKAKMYAGVTKAPLKVLSRHTRIKAIIC